MKNQWLLIYLLFDTIDKQKSHALMLFSSLVKSDHNAEVKFKSFLF